MPFNPRTALSTMFIFRSQQNKHYTMQIWIVGIKGREHVKLNKCHGRDCASESVQRLRSGATLLIKNILKTIYSY